MSFKIDKITENFSIMNNDYNKPVFGKQTPGYKEWRTENSIFRYIASHLNKQGELTLGFLPDENEATMMFLPGEFDVLFGAEQSKVTDKKARYLTDLLSEIAETGDKFKEQEFYQLITNPKYGVVIGSFVQAYTLKSFPEEPYLVSFARDLATKSALRNAVKYGMAILGFCADRSSLDDIKILGLHEEFTPYAVLFIDHHSDNPIHDIWDLARKVHGWGRIQSVEHLSHMDIDESIKEWFVREGFRNDIDNKYLALICARRGELHEMLHRPEIDPRLYNSAAELLQALIADSRPKEGISAYKHAAVVISDFIRHAKRYANRIVDFIIIRQLKDFLAGLQHNPGAYRKNGWDEDIIARCMAGIAVILESRDWKNMVSETLKDVHHGNNREAKQAAQYLDIDLWETAWNNLQTNPESYAVWLNVELYQQREHAAELIDFATRYFPFDEVASGAKNLEGWGQTIYFCLDLLILYLANFSGQGEKIILTGLKSPAVQNRHKAIIVLKKWKRENWSPEIERELLHLRDIEPNEDTRADIDKLLS